LTIMRTPIHQPGDNDAPSARATSPFLHNQRNTGLVRRPPADGPAFSGDRGFLELQRQLALTPSEVPEPPESFDGRGLSSTLSRFALLAGVAAMIALGVAVVPGLLKGLQGGAQDDVASNKANVVPASSAATPSQADRMQPRVVAVVPVSEPPAAAPIAPAPVPVAPAPAANAAPTVVASAMPSDAASAVVAPLAAVTAAAINTPAAASPSPPAIQMPPAVQAAPPQPVAVAPATPPAPAAADSSNTPSLDSAEIATLLKRGQYFMDSGDISSAQVLYRRAAEGGSAQGAFALASTYDAHYLAEHHVIGVLGNEAKARLWYQRAVDLGSQDAKGMLAQLGGGR
jgi:hypothetical protein